MGGVFQKPFPATGVIYDDTTEGVIETLDGYDEHAYVV